MACGTRSASLPETGPLRFGLPHGAGARAGRCRRAGPARRGSPTASRSVVLGMSAVWAFEAFAYTVARVRGDRRRRRRGCARRASARDGWFAQAALAVARMRDRARRCWRAVTLLGSGHLPDWGQYLAYLHSFLLGGEAGAISYGFARLVSRAGGRRRGVRVGGTAVVLLIAPGAAVARRWPRRSSRWPAARRTRSRCSATPTTAPRPTCCPTSRCRCSWLARCGSRCCCAGARDAASWRAAGRSGVRGRGGGAADLGAPGRRSAATSRDRAGPRVSRRGPAGRGAPALASAADRSARARGSPAARPLRPGPRAR